MRTFFPVLLLLLIASYGEAAQKVGSVARVKGQESTTIHGMGLVVGLKGTGDKTGEFKEAARSLARMLELTGHPNVSEKEIATSKNVALVSVSVTIPPQGARSGDLLDCSVRSIGNASSLKDGELLITDLIGPIPQAPEHAITLAKAAGKISLESPEITTGGKVIRGARMTSEFRNPYIKDGCLTLVLPQKFASFAMAVEIAAQINDNSDAGPVAQVLDQQNVVVKIPRERLGNPAEYVSDILAYPLLEIDKVPTVTINERAGVIVIDREVEIAPVTVSHKNVVIQVGGAGPQQPGQAEPQPPQRWVNVDPEGRRNDVENVKLSALRDSLNAMKVPTPDIIEIIRSIDRQGNLYGQIVYE